MIKTYLSDFFDFKNVPRGTFLKLEEYKDIVILYSRSMNLISKKDLHDIDHRHILDSAQIIQYIPEDIDVFMDIGSGCGFPGIVLKILLEDRMPDLHFYLVERSSKMCSFLDLVNSQLNLGVSIVNIDIKDVSNISPKVVSCRAFKSISEIFFLTENILGKDTIFLLHKGKNYEAEIDDALKEWNMTLNCYDSITDPYGKILVIREVSRVI